MLGPVEKGRGWRDKYGGGSPFLMDLRKHFGKLLLHYWQENDYIAKSLNWRSYSNTIVSSQNAPLQAVVADTLINCTEYQDHKKGACDHY